MHLLLFIGLSKLRSDLTQHYPQSLVENIFYCQVFNETDLEWHQKRYTDQLKVKREAKQISKLINEIDSPVYYIQVFKKLHCQHVILLYFVEVYM